VDAFFELVEISPVHFHPHLGSIMARVRAYEVAILGTDLPGVSCHLRRRRAIMLFRMSLCMSL